MRHIFISDKLWHYFDRYQTMSGNLVNWGRDATLENWPWIVSDVGRTQKRFFGTPWSADRMRRNHPPKNDQVAPSANIPKYNKFWQTGPEWKCEMILGTRWRWAGDLGIVNMSLRPIGLNPPPSYFWKFASEVLWKQKEVEQPSVT